MSRADARGEAVARILRGSWRAEPPPLEASAVDVAAVAPTLLATGAAGLGWWRLRGAGASGRKSAEDGEHAATLQDAFRLQAIDARLHEQRLSRIAALLAEGGVDYVLAKGWSVARLYARPGLRPYGDYDVFVVAEQLERATRVLAADEEQTARVDLHAGVPLLDVPWSRVHERAETTAVEGVPLRVLGAEDHLALLCAHLFAHGAWRPTWLCDIAAFVEAAPDTFEWSRVQTLSRRVADECRVTVLLAGRLLGADLEGTPWSGTWERLPRWLPRAVERAWGRGGHYSVTTRIGLERREARTLLRAVRVRWPNEVEATFRWRAPLNGFPRLPFQVLDVLSRTGHLFAGGSPS